MSDKNEALRVNLFDNPNIPSEVKEKLRAKEDVDFSIDYDFSKISQYVNTRRNGIINLTTKVTALYDSQNRFINYLFINIDTTETTNAYTKIQEFENLFLLIGDYAKVGFAHFNVLTRDGYAKIHGTGIWERKKVFPCHRLSEYMHMWFLKIRLF